jgi:hypothetical protein
LAAPSHFWPSASSTYTNAFTNRSSPSCPHSFAQTATCTLSILSRVRFPLPARRLAPKRHMSASRIIIYGAAQDLLSFSRQRRGAHGMARHRSLSVYPLHETMWERDGDDISQCIVNIFCFFLLRILLLSVWGCSSLHFVLLLLKFIRACIPTSSFQSSNLSGCTTNVITSRIVMHGHFSERCARNAFADMYGRRWRELAHWVS